MVSSPLIFFPLCACANPSCQGLVLNPATLPCHSASPWLPAGLRIVSPPFTSPTKFGALSLLALSSSLPRRGCSFSPCHTPTWPPGLCSRETSLAHCSLKQGWKGKCGWGPGLRVLVQEDRTIFGECTREQVNHKRIPPSSRVWRDKSFRSKSLWKRLKKARPRIPNNNDIPCSSSWFSTGSEAGRTDLAMAPLPALFGLLPSPDTHAHGHAHTDLTQTRVHERLRPVHTGAHTALRQTHRCAPQVHT